MVYGHFKGFVYTLTNGNAGHNYNKLAPAVFFIQLKHCFYVNIGFTRACFHFNIKAALTYAFYKLGGKLYIVLGLDRADIVQKLFVGQIQHFVFIARFIV